VKEYEGLFILDTENSATGVDGIIENVGALISEAGGKVLKEQKLERKAFARVANRKHTGGFYVSLIFEMEPSQLKDFNTVLAKRPEVFRAQITYAPAEPVAD
jgi:ribosomal protein S6